MGRNENVTIFWTPTVLPRSTMRGLSPASSSKPSSQESSLSLVSFIHAVLLAMFEKELPAIAKSPCSVSSIQEYV